MQYVTNCKDNMKNCDVITATPHAGTIQYILNSMLMPAILIT